MPGKVSQTGSIMEKALKRFKRQKNIQDGLWMATVPWPGEIQNLMAANYWYIQVWGRLARQPHYPRGEILLPRTTEPGVCYRDKSYRATTTPYGGMVTNFHGRQALLFSFLS